MTKKEKEDHSLCSAVLFVTEELRIVLRRNWEDEEDEDGDDKVDEEEEAKEAYEGAGEDMLPSMKLCW
jgi:hypothetical protein